MTSEFLSKRRVRSLCAGSVAVLTVAISVLVFTPTPSDAIIPRPTTTTIDPRRTTTTSTATTEAPPTSTEVPATSSAAPPATTEAPPSTPPPLPETTAPPEPDDEQVVQPLELPCIVDAIDDLYTIATDAVLTVPYQAGLAQNDVVCDVSHKVGIITDPQNGSVVGVPAGSFDYTPDPGFDGMDFFTYSLFKNGIEVDQAVATIWVIDDCTVVAAADGFSTPFDTALSVTAPGFAANDTLACPSYEPFTFQIAADPVHGTVVEQGGGAFDYQPDPSFIGLDKFTYYVRGGFQSLVMAIGTVSIYVEGTDCVAVDDTYTTTVDQPVAVPPPGVLGNDTLCPHLHTLEMAQPSHGTVTPGLDGDFDYFPDAGYVGQDSFTYDLMKYPSAVPHDDEVLATATVTIDVIGPDTTTTTTTVPDTTTTSTTTSTTTTIATIPDSPTTIPDSVPESTSSGPDTSAPEPEESVPAGGFRVATFNASLNRAAEGELVQDLSTADDPQAANVAEIIQRTQPDIVVLNEFDYVEGGAAVDLFRSNYLAVSQNGAEPIDYPYYFIAPTNTGVPSGFDLDHDGTVGGANDAFGFGEFPGQYGMVVYSKYPIVEDQVRTFQNLLWSSMPDARLPDDPATPEPADWYSAEELAVLRLSSKSHWDVPIDVNGRIVHVLASHPTPPVFDGEEDRNGLRNADEIRLWADYIAGTDTSWIVDDAGTPGGLAADAEFVIVGDLNSDPLDGDSLQGATQQLLDLDRVQDPLPTSDGAVEAAETQGLVNAEHQNDPANDTADFADDPAPGNLRADYVLSSDGFVIIDAGVYWPPTSDPLSSLVVTDPFTSSDHRLVWVALA